MFRLANGMEAEAGASVKAAMSVYLDSAIREDWPAMERGGESAATSMGLDRVYAALLAYEPDGAGDMALLVESLRQADVLTQARRARIVVADGVVPGVVWFVLLLGAFVTIAFTFFFGTANIRAQVWMTGALSLLICSCLLIIVAIDRPFAGIIKLDPDPIVAVLENSGVSGSGFD